MEEWDEYYHSMHGAYNEAVHVYVESGLAFWSAQGQSKNKPCSIFEMGFGTGLNALMTLEYAHIHNLDIVYNTIEAFPLQFREIQELDFDSFFKLENSKNYLRELHLSPWDKNIRLSPNFSFLKNKILLENFKPIISYDLIYYDAFGFRVQPEMWSLEALRPIVHALAPHGVFVTYSAKGSVRRSLEALGLKVFRIEGPPGKREMLRAIRA
ncbi:MAG: tRNA U34 5-methylaminomethyl-2-thiouridine-forming methyltransferase MnmC [Candidatus Arcticimaribacter sp.]|jgi:tRNA U34 5-methylaminomethyl-2-thiouridine-forming methyltransferase MnmC